jgi:recombination DNA repair RAD52 pathway protein
VPGEAKRGLTRNQVLLLLRAVSPDIVERTQGKAYIPQFEARAAMNRIFGPGNWDSEVVSQELIYETKLVDGDSQYPSSSKDKSKPYYVACYRMGVRVNVRDFWGNPISSNLEYHVEENAPLPNRGEAHAFALTSCESYALRRALINMGDALGLHLYNKGSLDPVVNKTLLLEDPESPLYREPKVVSTTPQPEANPAPDTNQLAAGFDHPEGRKG